MFHVSTKHSSKLLIFNAFVALRGRDACAPMSAVSWRKFFSSSEAHPQRAKLYFNVKNLLVKAKKGIAKPIVPQKARGLNSKQTPLWIRFAQFAHG